MSATGRSNEAQAEGLGQADPNRHLSPEGAEESLSIPHVPLVVGDSGRVQQVNTAFAWGEPRKRPLTPDDKQSVGPPASSVGHPLPSEREKQSIAALSRRKRPLIRRRPSATFSPRRRKDICMGCSRAGRDPSSVVVPPPPSPLGEGKTFAWAALAPEVTPHPTSSLGHLLPWEKGKDSFLRAGALKMSVSLSEGRGWTARRVFSSARGTGEGLLPRVVPPRPHCIDNLPHKLVLVLQNQGVRDPQQSYAESPQMIFFLSVPAHLVDLRVNAAVKLNGQSMLKAVEIQDTLFNAELTAKLRAQPAIPQESPRGLFRFRWGPSQFANSRGGDFHGAIIPVPPERSRAGAPKKPLIRRCPSATFSPRRRKRSSSCARARSKHSFRSPRGEGGQVSPKGAK